MVDFNLKLRPMAQAFVVSAVAVTYPALAMAAELRHPHPPPAWIAITVSLSAFLLLIWALSKIVHSNKEIERALRGDPGDRSVTPVPDDDHLHPHIFH